MRSGRSAKHILLINPPIYDFAAYDLWLKPLGLLYVGATLRRNGYQIRLVDALDRNHPEMRKLEKSGDRKSDGRGKFHRQIVDKPRIFNWVPRHYARYGYTEELFRNELRNGESPDAVLITSLITYWYPGVEYAIHHVRDIYPDVPILLGGIYPTLCGDHAAHLQGVTHRISGHGERQVIDWLDAYFGIQEKYLSPAQSQPLQIPWDLYPDLTALIVLTSRGCPYRCSFCATHLLNSGFQQRDPHVVASEILSDASRNRTSDVVFYDDALFIRKHDHIEQILDVTIDSGQALRFHTPNGLFAKMIDPGLARKMKTANFTTLRLSLETSNDSRRQNMSYKVSNSDLINALDHLEDAGYARKDMEVYAMMGIPGQTAEEVRRSLEFIHSTGATIRLASYTPIPGTEDFRIAAARHGLNPTDDPLLWNNTIYPLRNRVMDYDTYTDLRAYAGELNSRLRGVN